MLRLFPAAALLILIGPVVAGLGGIVLPAFGFLPALGGERLTLEPFRALLATPGIARSAATSLLTGFAATSIAFVTVMTCIAGWRGSRAFQLLARLVAPLLSVPHAAAAFGLTFLIAPAGLLFALAAPLAGWARPPDLLVVHDRLGLTLTLGLVVKEVPFLFLMALAALPQARPARMEKLTASLGYGRLIGFLHGPFPALYRQIRLPVFAVMAYATSVVDVALILGPTNPAPLAVRILQWRNDPDLDRQFVAAAGAAAQIGVTGAALLLWLAAERIGRTAVRLLAMSGRRMPGDSVLRGLAAIAMTLCTAAVFAGLALLALWSVAGAWRFPARLPASLSWRMWSEVLPGLAGPVTHTLTLAAAASVLAVILALGTLESQARSAGRPAGTGLDVLYLPLVVPQVAFLFGLQILCAVAGLDGRFAAVLLVHLLFVLPYVLLSLAGPWRSWDPRYGQAARALGHGRDFVFWRIRLPMLIRPVLTAAALGFAVSASLYLPTLLVGAGRWPTITTETVALASGGDRRIIGATALIQAVLPFAGFALAAVVTATVFRNRRLMRPA